MTGKCPNCGFTLPYDDEEANRPWHDVECSQLVKVEIVNECPTCGLIHKGGVDCGDAVEASAYSSGQITPFFPLEASTDDDERRARRVWGAPPTPPDDAKNAPAGPPSTIESRSHSTGMSDGLAAVLVWLIAVGVYACLITLALLLRYHYAS